MDLNKYTYKQISILFGLLAAISSCRPFWEKCTQWLKNDVKHFEVKGTPYVLHLLRTPESQISTRFTLRPAIFKALGIETNAPNELQITLNN